MQVITKKLFSLCSDFSPEEGFQDIYDELSSEYNCNVYLDYTAMSKETEAKKGYENDPIANRLVELGAEDNEEVLIHIDY